VATAQDYDAALHQFREPQKVVRLNHAIFLRWLAERGRLEHFPSGPPSGHVAALVADVERRSCLT